MNVNDVPVYGPLTTVALPGLEDVYSVVNCKIFAIMATDMLKETWTRRTYGMFKYVDRTYGN